MGEPKQFPNLARVLESHGHEWHSKTRDALVKLRTSFDSDPSVEEWVEQGDLLDQMLGKQGPAEDEAPAEPPAAPGGTVLQASPDAAADEAPAAPDDAGPPAAPDDAGPPAAPQTEPVDEVPGPRTEDDTTVPNALYRAKSDEAAAQSAAADDEATVDEVEDDEPAEEEGVPPTLPASAFAGAEPGAGTGRSATAVVDPALTPSPVAPAGGTVIGEPFELPSAFAPAADRPALQPAPPLAGRAVAGRRKRETGGGLGRILGAAALVTVVVIGGAYGIGQLASSGDDADEIEPVPVKSKKSRKSKQGESSPPKQAQPPPEPVIPPNPPPVPYEPPPPDPPPPQPAQPAPKQPAPKQPQPAQPQPTQPPPKTDPTQPPPKTDPTQPQPTQPQPTQPTEPKPWIMPSVLPTLPGG